MSVTTRLKLIENRLYIEPEEQINIVLLGTPCGKEIGLPEGTPQAEVEKAYREKYPNYYKVIDMEEKCNVLDEYEKLYSPVDLGFGTNEPRDTNNPIRIRLLPDIKDPIWDKVAEFMDKEWKH